MLLILCQVYVLLARIPTCNGYIYPLHVLASLTQLEQLSSFYIIVRHRGQGIYIQYLESRCPQAVTPEQSEGVTKGTEGF